MARNLNTNPKKQRPEINRWFNFNQTRNKRKMRKVESKGISTCCIVLTLLGLAVVAGLAIIICFIVNPSETQYTNEHRHKSTQNNRHNQTATDDPSPADGMATIRTILIIFSTTTISLTIAIFITCIVIQRSKKKRPIKQTDGSSLSSKDLKKTLESAERNMVEDNLEENEDDDETSCKKCLIPQMFPINVTDVLNKNTGNYKISQFEVCSEKKRNHLCIKSRN